MNSDIFDITIIGGGPVGLYAAGAASELGAMCYLIESRLHLGGIMQAVYPDKDVYNFPGIQIIKGRDLVTDLAQKAKTYGMKARLGEYVSDIKPGSKSTVIVTTNKDEYYSSTVVIASGLRAYYSTLIDRIKISEWNGSGIYENWPKADDLKGKRVAVITSQSTPPAIPEDILKIAPTFTWVCDSPAFSE